jgi:hypothetical protein
MSDGLEIGQRDQSGMPVHDDRVDAFGDWCLDAIICQTANCCKAASVNFTL